MEPDVYDQCIDDDDVEFYDCAFEINGSGSDIKADENDGGGRVLPSWSTPGNGKDFLL